MLKTVSTDEAVLASRRSAHTLADLEPPSRLALSPAHGTTAACADDAGAAGCRVTVVLEFSEDLLRGSGNLYIDCKTFACGDIVTIDLSTASWTFGDSEVRNNALIVRFVSSGLLDLRDWTIRYDEGIVTDKWMNPCAAYDGHAAAFVFSTP